VDVELAETGSQRCWLFHLIQPFSAPIRVSQVGVFFNNEYKRRLVAKSATLPSN
jgi:hypothetical protein